MYATMYQAIRGRGYGENNPLWLQTSHWHHINIKCKNGVIGGLGGGYELIIIREITHIRDYICIKNKLLRFSSIFEVLLRV